MSVETPDVDRYISILATWNSLSSCCEKCASLNGYQWILTPNDLNVGIQHPEHGLVYDFILDTSTVHPNCMCNVDLRIELDLSRFLESLQLEKLNAEQLA